MTQMNKGINLTWVSEKCFEHEKYPEGIQMLEVLVAENKKEMKCWLCERERTTKELEKYYTVQKERLKENEKYDMLRQQSILQDKTLLNARFDNYIVQETEEHNNLGLMKNFAQDILNGQTFNVWLVGPPGVGKSHLSYAVLHFVNENSNKSKSCLFIDIDEMLRQIRASINNGREYQEEYFTTMLSRVDVLVLDDLGAETGNERTEKIATDFTGRILRAISNARQDKVTIITTNLPSEQLFKMYDGKTLSRLTKKRRPVLFRTTKDKRALDLEF